MLDARKQHWPEYLMEAAGLGIFTISAWVFGTVPENPASPVSEKRSIGYTSGSNIAM